MRKTVILTKVRTPAHGQRTEASWSLRLCLHSSLSDPNTPRAVLLGSAGRSGRGSPEPHESLGSGRLSGRLHPAERASPQIHRPLRRSPPEPPPGQGQKRVGHSRPSPLSTLLSFLPWDAGRTAGRGCLGIAVELTRCSWTRFSRFPRPI